MSARALKLVVYDATDVGSFQLPRLERGDDGTARGVGGLTRWWKVGAKLHRLVMHADASLGARSWDEALRWASWESKERGARIAELQVWGHGGWGFMQLGKLGPLDRDALSRTHALHDELDAFRDRLDPEALVWLRCCSAFGAEAGRAFAPALAERLRARVAGHTFIIGAFQSGTHSLARGGAPTWEVDEGVAVREDGVRLARDSSAHAPHTITCLRLGLPKGW